jgi:hypothetical protein
MPLCVGTGGAVFVAEAPGVVDFSVVIVAGDVVVGATAGVGGQSYWPFERMKEPRRLESGSVAVGVASAQEVVVVGLAGNEE